MNSTYVHEIWRRVKGEDKIVQVAVTSRPHQPGAWVPSSQPGTPPRANLHHSCTHLHILSLTQRIDGALPPNSLLSPAYVLTTTSFTPALSSPTSYWCPTLHRVNTESQVDEHTKPQSTTKYLASEHHWPQDKWRQQTPKAPRNLFASS